MTIEQLKERFCSKDETRGWIQEPFVDPKQPGFVFATDGRVMVRMDSAPGLFVKVPITNKPPRDDIMGRFPFNHSEVKAEDWRNLPVPLPVRVCWACKGTGRSYPCECWDDDGYHAEDCLKCEGLGWLSSSKDDKHPSVRECPICEGAGTEWEDEVKVIPFEKAFLSNFYVILLNSLPGCRIESVPTDSFDPHHTPAIRFKWEFGLGYIMPCRPLNA